MHSHYQYSVSATTRPPRAGEIDGKHYFFVSNDRFKQMIAEGKLLEWAEVHAHFYGTPCEYTQKKLGEGQIIIADLDFQGGRSVKQKLPHQSLLIFLLPPSLKVLEKRLRQRGLDTPEVLGLRLRNALEEISYCFEYDYVLINDDLDETIKRVGQIIEAERWRSPRLSLSISQEPQLQKKMASFRHAGNDLTSR